MGIVSSGELPGTRKKTAGTWFSAPSQQEETAHPVNSTCARKVEKTDGEKIPPVLKKNSVVWSL